MTKETIKIAEKLYILAVDYLELKEVRDHYDGLMKELSKELNAQMTDEDIASFKEGLVSVSMSNGAKTSIKTFKQCLIEEGVSIVSIAKADTAAKPEPKYSPRISKLKKAHVGNAITKGIGAALILFALAGSAFAGTKVPVCVGAELNSDGFVRADLADPVKDVTKQVKKSKKLVLHYVQAGGHWTDYCSINVVITARGQVGTGDTSYSHGTIREIKSRYLDGRLEMPDGRTTTITQSGSWSRSWGHLAKKFREQIEDFCQMNGVK